MGAYETDGMYGAPVIETNCFESIEMAMTFDVRDWSEDRRSAWIWGIVFGYEEEGLYEMKKKHGWSDEDANRLNKYHEEWKRMKVSIEPGEGTSNNL